LSLIATPCLALARSLRTWFGGGKSALEFLYRRKEIVASMTAQCQNLLRRLFSELEE
jgi:hypothetical protein